MADKKDFVYDPDRNALHRGDYRPTEYKIPSVKLDIQLDEEETVVTSHIHVTRNPALPHAGGALVLDGEAMKLKSLKITENGVTRDMDRSEFVVTDKNLILKNPPAQPFDLEIVTQVNPKQNTTLSGIYMAGDILCSQCEAQGFRRITYFLDRPDNLATYDVKLTGDMHKFPVLLSNGNGVPTQTVNNGDGTHSITWNDPWPKPSYLFAVVAGDMHVIEDTFTTMNGKKVDLRIYVQDGYEDKVTWAMESLKRSMKWDEDRYGREYDLDCFHIVAVDKFNAGAMENKGLNVFNVKYLVGSPEMSTDDELIDIEAVIGHEYFHNYSGDRVTVRDWFELTLKEGLTVLRDRQFTEDMHSKEIKRIDDAIGLRSAQFMEDAGPTSHPIRPDRVEEFDNIYTGTIYEKGSHVLGMLHTMMGETTWRSAMDEYFTRFDGQAVTCDDFVDVMQEVSGIDLTQFRKWYSQSGTPEISYSGHYDAATQTYRLTLTQNTPPSADQAHKEPMHMPIALGLIGADGNDIPLSLSTDAAGSDAPATRVLHLTEASQTFEFKNVDGPVVPSLLRGFSAPVKITTQPADDELVFRMAHDSDGFNKYEATERLMVKTLHKLIQQAENDLPLTLDAGFIAAYGENVKNAATGDLAFNARTLGLPPYNIIIQDLKVLDPDAVAEAVDFLKTTLAKTFEPELKSIYAATAAPAGEKYDVVPAQVGRRELHNTVLGFIGKLETPEAALDAVAQYGHSKNMTEKLAALGTLTRMTSEDAIPVADKLLGDFYTRYKDNNNLVDKWLSLQAGRPAEGALERVKDLMKHEAYDPTNPNKVYALIGGFTAGNPSAFHDKDGSGYKFLADTIIDLNDINAKTATNLAKRFTQFKRYDSERQDLMVEQMQRIMALPTLDIGIKEIIGKALDTVEKKQTNDNKRKSAPARKQG
ncbi:MAG: aminopeptidase N [Bdellovibrionales bacterium]|jgi:aminopeptidase N|nr:aminopeptidase N [Bdellovibrionales bacterium]